MVAGRESSDRNHMGPTSPVRGQSWNCYPCRPLCSGHMTSSEGAGMGATLGTTIEDMKGQLERMLGD